jgi:uncharacterized protein DUF998
VSDPEAEYMLMCGRSAVVRKVLLSCGIASSLLYVVMNVIAAMGYPGYDSVSQTVSELSAIGAPTRDLWVPAAMVYEILVIAFGIGVWMSAHAKRPLQVVAGLLLAYGIFNFWWPPMHQRQVIAAGGGTVTDQLHLVWAGVAVLFMFLFVAFGSAAFGKRFRVYSIGTILVLLFFGALTFPSTGAIATGQPTPWVGVWERINIFVYLQWIAVLAMVLMLETQPARQSATATASRRLTAPAPTH